MAETDFTPDQNGSFAVAHFLAGLMKIDGLITKDEKSKVDLLVRRFRSGMPGSPEVVMENLDIIYQDPDFKHFMPNQHMDAGFVFFDDFVASGEAKESHISMILDLVDLLKEVGGSSESELLYLERLAEEFGKRYDSPN